MTINFFYEQIQQQDPDNWEIVAEFAAQMLGFTYKEFISNGDFLLRLEHLKTAVDKMVKATERLT
jgi:hypothetical protein